MCVLEKKASHTGWNNMRVNKWSFISVGTARTGLEMTSDTTQYMKPGQKGAEKSIHMRCAVS